MPSKRKDYSELKSGSDVRGVACEGLAGQPVTLTREDAYAITRAYVRWLRAHGSAAKVSAGCDSRISSPDLHAAVCAALLAEGCQAVNCGMTTTPSMFLSTLPDQLDCDGAIMITASHLPWNRNGMKFFTRQGGLEGADITRILADTRPETLPADLPAVPAIDWLGQYSALLVSQLREATTVQRPLAGLRIIVDAGNGVGGFFAKSVLEPLGADTTGSLYLEPDGMFPNHIPNPEDADAMRSICDAVRVNRADLGIIFDTDCDRAAVVDSNAAPINRNRLIALMAAIVLEKYPGATIVTDSVTSDGLAQFIADLGGVHRRFKRGYKNVIDEARRLEAQGVSAPMAIETSGHCALRDNYFLDDGAYLVTRVLVKMAQLNAQGRALGDLIRMLAEPAEEAELRFALHAPDFKALGEQVLARVTKAVADQPGWVIAPDNHEGIRANSAEGQGWFLLRMSLHDPVMPLNMESNIAGGCRVIARQLQAMLKGVDALDITALDQYVGTSL